MTKSKFPAWISTTIKRKYFDQILAGTKTVELKECNEYWCHRLDKIYATFMPNKYKLNLLCGREVAKFWISSLEIHDGPIEIDGKIVNRAFKIGIGERIQ